MKSARWVWGIGVLFLIIPAFAAAEVLIPQPSVEQLLAREAFVKAQVSGTSVVCVVKTNKSSVRVNEPFMLWWGSYGGDGTGWTSTGAFAMVIRERGVREYKFVFRAVSGTSATCRTTVSVS